MSLTDKKEAIYTTVTTASYLPRAMIMAKSVKRHIPDCKVIVCIVEDKIPVNKELLNAYFDHVILAKDLVLSNFQQFVFQYNQAQAACACKAQLMLYLLESYRNYNYFIFLNSDTRVFGPFNELLDDLERNEIILSPHFVQYDEDNPLYHLRTIHLYGIQCRKIEKTALAFSAVFVYANYFYYTQLYFFFVKRIARSQMISKTYGPTMAI